MRTIRIEPYKTWSGGAKALGNRCGILRATKRQVRKHGDFDVIINWGRTERRFNGRYINEPENVGLACDKKASFEILAEKEVPIPEFTSDKVRAQEWLDSGSTVVVRRLLRANSGRGIILCCKETHETIPAAPLYTLYCKKAEEYRIHVVNGEVVDVQLKRRRLETPDEEVNYQIRNGANGWVFTRDNVDPPESVLDAAVRSVAAFNLTFGAVDIGYNQHKQEAIVYEVNTAPGLEGTTLDNYYEAFRKLLPSINGGRYLLRRTKV